MEKSKASPVCLQTAAKIGPSVDFVDGFVADELFQNEGGSLPTDAPQTEKAAVKPGPEQMPQIGVQRADVRRFYRQVQQVFADFHQGLCTLRRGIDAAKKLLPRGLDRRGEKRKVQFIRVFQIVRCGTVKGFLVWSEFTGEHLVKPNALDRVHRGIGIDDFLGEGGLRGFATLR